jgi:hypothetical protein
MIRKCRILVFCIAVLLCSGFAISQEKKNGFGIDFKYSVERSTAQREVDSLKVPIGLRTLPSHSDDTWLYGSSGANLVVPNAHLWSDSVPFYMSVSIAPQYRTKSGIILRGGATVNFFSIGHRLDWASLPDDPAAYEVNQYGYSARGTGASDIYMFLKPGKNFQIRPFIEFEKRFGGLGMLVGYTRFDEKIMIENGYDRYASLQKYGAKELASDISDIPYLGLRIGPDWVGGFFHVGPEFHHNLKIVTSGNVEVARQKNAYIAFGMYFKFPRK